MYNEIRIVLVTLMMQDCPFFILRTVCVFKFGIVTYLFLFFTFKNGILFALQVYKIFALYTDFSQESKNILNKTITNTENGIMYE